MDELQRAAASWLLVAEELGWGVEGPFGADEVRGVVQALADGRDPRTLQAAFEERDPGLRPVDALFEAANLLSQASLTSGPHRQAELISSARGWLRIASGR